MINETNYLFTKERLKHIIQMAKENNDDFYINGVRITIMDKIACADYGLAFYTDSNYKRGRTATVMVLYKDIKTVELVNNNRIKISKWSVGTD